jgi:hypothetical protein
MNARIPELKQARLLLNETDEALVQSVITSVLKGEAVQIDRGLSNLFGDSQ